MQAVFQTLSRLRFASHPSLPGPGLIITVCSSTISFILIHVESDLRGLSSREKATLTSPPVNS